MKAIYLVSKSVRRVFGTQKGIVQWRPRTIVVALFAFVFLGHVFYSAGDFAFATASASIIGDGVQSAFNWLLYGIARIFGLLGVAGSVLFVYVLDAGVINDILGSPVIDVIWTIVRDVLNLAFILILLFSAFATIFQVESYHLRNILVRLVIMALLVNFSLPITKVIIDASNILMYFFVNTLFPKAASGTGFEIPEIFGKATNIVDVFVPQKEQSEQTTGYILMALIFAFFYGISMITIAGLLVVRLVALAILMIFSPIGFVAMILPSTQIYAQKWWQNLLKYAFTAPILIFMLFFAMSFMAYTHDMAFRKDSDTRIIKTTDVATTDAKQTSNMTNLVFLMIPIVVLWSGIIMTNTASDGASQMVTNFGRGIASKTGRFARRGGRYLAVGAAREVGRGADMATGRIVTGSVQRVRDLSKRRTEKRTAARQARADTLTLDKQARTAAKTRTFTKSVAAAEKELKDLGLTLSQLETEMQNGATTERKIAAARLFAQKGGVTKVEHMDTAMRAVSAAPESLQEDYTKELQGTVRKEGRRDVIAQYRVNHLDAEPKGMTKESIIKKEYQIGAEDLGKQKSFDALKDDSSKTLKMHVDQNIIFNEKAVYDAVKSGNAEQLVKVSDKVKSGVGPRQNQSSNAEQLVKVSDKVKSGAGPRQNQSIKDRLREAKEKSGRA